MRKKYLLVMLLMCLASFLIADNAKANTGNEVLKASVTYSTHVQDIGWQNAVSDGKTAGTVGKAKQLESIKISISNMKDLGVKYSTHVQDVGWLDFISDGKESGTTGRAKQLEAIKIELTGPKAPNYEILYRVHVQDIGWMDWVKNGEIAGTTGKAKQLESIEIKLVEKVASSPINQLPVDSDNPTNNKLSLLYKSYVQNSGWLEPVADGALSGTVGKAKHIESIQVSILNAPFAGGISYETHVQDYGWIAPVSDGKSSGFEGKNKQIEAIKVKLTGEMANHYDVYYRVHSEDFGWLDWAKNGQPAGTQGMIKQVEAMELILVEKDGPAPGETAKPFQTAPSVVYSSHVQDIGWMTSVANGKLSGTSGQRKRLEAIKINLQDSPYKGDIVYSTFVQDMGWLDNVSNDEISGTIGKGKKVGAITVELKDVIANYYDVYYRVHVQDFGWLGWAKNGMKAGTEGSPKQVEAVEIKLVLKGKGQPVDANAAYKKSYIVFLDPGHGGSDPGAVRGGYSEANLNFAVAKKVQAILLDRGYTVYMSRDGNTRISNLDRSRTANGLNANVYVSIHHNSTSGDSTNANGIESYYYQYNPNYPSKINEEMHNNPERVSKSITLANLIQKKMIEYTGAKNIGTFGETWEVVREASMPATLLELGFLNNPTERSKLVSDSYQNKLAKAIADGIDEYFKVY